MWFRAPPFPHPPRRPAAPDVMRTFQAPISQIRRGEGLPRVDVRAPPPICSHNAGGDSHIVEGDSHFA